MNNRRHFYLPFKKDIRNHHQLKLSGPWSALTWKQNKQGILSVSGLNGALIDMFKTNGKKLRIMVFIKN